MYDIQYSDFVNIDNMLPDDRKSPGLSAGAFPCECINDEGKKA